MADTERLEQANVDAQRAFHAMVAANVQSDPNHPYTRAYVFAEAACREVLTDIQWEKAKAELDALQTADLAAGDHFAGMPR